MQTIEPFVTVHKLIKKFNSRHYIMLQKFNCDKDHIHQYRIEDT